MDQLAQLHPVAQVAFFVACAIIGAIIFWKA